MPDEVTETQKTSDASTDTARVEDVQDRRDEKFEEGERREEPSGLEVSWNNGGQGRMLSRCKMILR